MNEQVSSAIIIPNSDCLVTVPKRISDNCLHLAFFVSSVLGSWRVSCRLVFISLDLQVRSLLFKGVHPFLELNALCNNVPLWVVFFDQVLNVFDLSFYVGHF